MSQNDIALKRGVRCFPSVFFLSRGHSRSWRKYGQTRSHRTHSVRKLKTIVRKNMRKLKTIVRKNMRRERITYMQDKSTFPFSGSTPFCLRGPRLYNVWPAILDFLSFCNPPSSADPPGCHPSSVHFAHPSGL
jgi:hypothetical protein